jgi:hypothetical protein
MSLPEGPGRTGISSSLGLSRHSAFRHSAPRARHQLTPHTVAHFETPDHPVTMAERENLFTKKPERAFFEEARAEAAEQGKQAVLLKGFSAVRVSRPLAAAAPSSYNRPCLYSALDDDHVMLSSRYAGQAQGRALSGDAR